MEFPHKLPALRLFWLINIFFISNIYANCNMKIVLFTSGFQLSILVASRGFRVFLKEIQEIKCFTIWFLYRKILNTIARWILVNIIFAETAVTWGFLTNMFQNNQKTIIVTYVHVQDSSATTKIEYMYFALLIRKISRSEVWTNQRKLYLHKFSGIF